MPSFLVKHLGIPLVETISRKPVSRHLRDLLVTQWLEPDAIRAIQDRKLALLVEHAYDTVPLYRELMDRHGVKPSDVRSVDDLPKLPIVTKELIRANYPHNTVSSEFDRSKLIETSSSGSTGEPFNYVVTNTEKTIKWAAIYRSWGWAGYEMGDRFATLTVTVPHAFASGRLLRFLETRFSGSLGIPPYELNLDRIAGFAKDIIRFRPVMIRGYASALYSLAKMASEQGLRISAKAVCSTGETLFDFQREFMESFYGCKVHDGYGAEGMEIAAQCGSDGLYHVNAEGVVVEIVDSEGNVCPEDVEGQVVLTDLNHYSMPFIRYNVQDVAVRSNRKCSCGRGLPTIERIQGRLTDVGVTPSGKSIIVHFFTAMFMKLASKVISFQVVQERPDLLIVSVVPGAGSGDIKEDILAQTQEYVGPEVTVQVKIVDEIPMTKGGKRRLFISKCGLKAAGLSADD